MITLLSNVSDFFLWNCLTHKIMTNNKMIIINKAAPPTDPAIIGMDDPIISEEVPV